MRNEVQVDCYSALYPAGGIGRYTRDIAEALIERPDAPAFRLVYPRSLPGAVIPAYPQDRVAPLPWGARAMRLLWLASARAGVRPDGLYDRPAVFHSTTGLGPRFRRARLIVTIHDLSGITHPEWHPVRTAFLVSQATPSTARDADRVLCDSEFVRRQVVELLGVAEDRTRTQHLSVSSAFMPLDGKAARERLHRRFGLDLPFVLHVGTLEPRKNHVGLIGAFEALRRAGFPGLLVLVGKESWKVKPMLHRIESSPDRSHILRIRDADDHDLRALYSACAMFAFLSLDEGFGLPPLEAMACGAPCIVSRRSSLPEVTGDAALLVDPEDRPECAQALIHVWKSPDMRTELSLKGPPQAAKFSRAAFIDRVFSVYREMLAAGPRP